MPTGVWERPPLAARFWAKVDQSGDCWLWTGSLTAGGYGHFGANGTFYRAHRWAYEQEYGPIPSGLVLDHLCRTRNCVRPSHMEPVTHRVNILRGVGTAARNIVKTACPKGHPLTGANVYHPPKRPAHRHCLACLRARNAARDRSAKAGKQW